MENHNSYEKQNKKEEKEGQQLASTSAIYV